MANEEHVALLKQGVEAWNRWREENPDTEINLRGAKFVEENLCKVNLKLANLRSADFTAAGLSEAELSRAYLGDIYLHEANLRNANLFGTIFFEAYLIDTDRSHSNLMCTDFSAAILQRTKFSRAYCRFSTILRRCFVG